jgi:hypothetical protein
MAMGSWRAGVVACLLVAVTSTASPQGNRGGAPGPTAPTAAQRTPPRDRQPNGPRPAGTASISGRVVSLEGSPLRRTQVQLAGSGVTGRTVLTDNEGRYSFTDLPASRYSLRVFRGGFINLAYGQRTPTEPAKQIELADGQALSGIDIVLPRGSAITGRVVDEYGEPVLQAQVQALRYSYQPSGERMLQPGGNSAVTDDLGQFRLYGLNPGEYFVSAMSRNQFMPMERPGGDLLVFGGHVQEGYAPTYYPGTANPGEAQAITVGLGQELSVQLQLVPTRLAQISGAVFDSQGRPVNGSPVVLRPATGVIGGGANRGASTIADGTFTVTNVAPGDYYLDVRPRPQQFNGGPNQRGNAAAGPIAEMEFASVPITVDGDISGLNIVTGKGATISGRVVFEGTPPAGGLRIRVVAQPADPQRMLGLPGGNQQDGLVDADGSFELTRLTGPVFLRVTLTNTSGGPAPNQITVMTKSVMVDGVDVADVPFDPTRRGGRTNVTLVLTDKVTDVSGVVTDGHGAPLESSVLIVPEDLPPGVSPQRFQRMLRSDREGKFSVRGMPPGRYVAIAATSIDAVQLYDPAAAQRVRQRGHTFSVREGETVTFELSLTTDF